VLLLLTVPWLYPSMILHMFHMYVFCVVTCFYAYTLCDILSDKFVVSGISFKYPFISYFVALTSFPYTKTCLFNSRIGLLEVLSFHLLHDFTPLIAFVSFPAFNSMPSEYPARLTGLCLGLDSVNVALPCWYLLSLFNWFKIKAIPEKCFDLQRLEIFSKDLWTN
jgi:hypothetical protein